MPVESAKSELMAALQKEAEAARRRSQRLVEIGKRMPNPHEQNELIAMALAEGAPPKPSTEPWNSCTHSSPSEHKD